MAKQNDSNRAMRECRRRKESIDRILVAQARCEGLTLVTRDDFCRGTK